MSQSREYEPIDMGQFGHPHPDSIGIRTISDILSGAETTTDHVAIRSYIAITQWAHKHRTASLPLLQALGTAELRRTAELSQLGYHQDPDEIDHAMGMRNLSASSDTQTTVGWYVEGLSRSRIKPYQHTRFTHILFAIEHAIIAGENLMLSPEQIALLATATAYHDVGHAPLSHVGDEVLRHYGEPPHEIRSIEILKRYVDPEYAKQLTDIIMEKPGLGQILKLIDTWAYLQIDMPEAGIKLDVPHLPSLFGTHIRLHDDGVLEADAIGEQAIKDLLNVRSDAYGLFYTHPNSLALEAMHIKALQILIEKGKLSVAELRHDTDQRIYGALIHDAVDERFTGDLLGGFHMGRTSLSEGPYIPVMWVEKELFAGKSIEDIEAWARQILGIDDVRDLVVAMPQPPWTKVVTLKRDSGDSIDLQAERKIYFPQQGKVVICVNRKLGIDVLRRLSSPPIASEPPQLFTTL